MRSFLGFKCDLSKHNVFFQKKAFILWGGGATIVILFLFLPFLQRDILLISYSFGWNCLQILFNNVSEFRRCAKQEAVDKYFLSREFDAIKQTRILKETNINLFRKEIEVEKKTKTKERQG